MSNDVAWYWQYLRQKNPARSTLRVNEPLPDLYTRIVVRVLLGWKLVNVAPGHTPPARGDGRETYGQQRVNMWAERCARLYERKRARLYERRRGS